MRRFTTRVVAAAAIFLAPDSALALNWSALWLNDDQRAVKRMQQEDYAEAAETFDDPRWRAAAWYRAGEYERAAEAWTAMDDTQAHYNRGNALARAGNLEAAIAAYETVLGREPDHADARHNLELLREMTEDQDGSDSSEQQEEQNTDNEQDERSEQSETGGQRESRRDESSPDQSEDRDEQAGNPPDDPPENTQSQPDKKEQADGKAQATGELAPEAGLPEQQAAMEQWLRRVPDDPGGLLRRKFLYQYKRRERGNDGTEEPW